MCEYLPQSNFKWNFKEWTTDKILCLDNKGKKGYLFDIHFIIEKKCTICIMDTLLHPITNQLQTICSIHGCNKDIKSPKLKN